MKTLHALLISTACLLISEGADIINGRTAAPHSRPYMAYIKIYSGKYEYICGGTLIDSKWVLTAAHCKLPESKVKILLGAHSSDENVKEQGRQRFHVSGIFGHPHYNNISMRNDILLMELNTMPKFGKFVHSLSLPETFEDIKPGTVCETAGWGWTGIMYADHLMEVNVTILDRKMCQRRLKNEVYITENMMCTEVGRAGQDTCGGDSGGPLICNGVFRGIVSLGTHPCGMPGGAAVYTRLTKEYINWIKDIIKHQP